MSRKTGPTKSKWRARALKDEGAHVILMGTALKDPYEHEVQHKIKWEHCLYPSDGDQWKEADANAKLMAEAGTVHHETGLTPRQLAEQRTELLIALRAVVSLLEVTDEASAPGSDSYTAVKLANGVLARATGKAVER